MSTPHEGAPPTGAPQAEQVSGQPASDKLSTEIGDAFGEMFGQMIGLFEELARRFSLPAFCLKALHMLSSPMSMKELGQRFQCDPSFVTAIADMLDSHGLGHRETDTRDRRIKNLLLTPKGLALRERVERELATCMPWASLDTSERVCLLGLLRKMIKAEKERQARSAADTAPGKRNVTAARAGRGKTSRVQEQAASSRASRGETAEGPLDSGIDPPVAVGGYRAGEVTSGPGPAAPSIS